MNTEVTLLISYKEIKSFFYMDNELHLLSIALKDKDSLIDIFERIDKGVEEWLNNSLINTDKEVREQVKLQIEERLLLFISGNSK